MTLRPLLAGLLLAAAAEPSLAADDDENIGLRPSLSEEAPFSWSGLHIGAAVGGQWNTVAGTYYNPVFVAPSLPLDGEGILAGAYAGYDVQLGPVVVGLEADAEATGLSGRAEDRILNSFFDIDQKWQGSLRARLGYALDRALPYLTAGAAVGQWSIKGGTVIDPLMSFQTSDVALGWTIGAGLDYALTDQLIGRIEYRYTDFGTAARRIPINPDFARIDATAQTGRVGVAYKF